MILRFQSAVWRTGIYNRFISMKSTSYLPDFVKVAQIKEGINTKDLNKWIVVSDKDSTPENIKELCSLFHNLDFVSHYVGAMGWLNEKIDFESTKEKFEIWGKESKDFFNGTDLEQYDVDSYSLSFSTIIPTVLNGYPFSFDIENQKVVFAEAAFGIGADIEFDKPTILKFVKIAERDIRKKRIGADYFVYMRLTIGNEHFYVGFCNRPTSPLSQQLKREMYLNPLCKKYFIVGKGSFNKNAGYDLDFACALSIVKGTDMVYKMLYAYSTLDSDAKCKNRSTIILNQKSLRAYFAALRHRFGIKH